MNRRILAVVDDMFFKAKINGTATKLGITVEYPRSMDALLEAARKEPPDLILVDLNSQRTDPIAVADSFKADEALRSIPVVGYFAHVQVELQKRAKQAGFDSVVPRSVFNARLQDVLQGNL